VQVESGSYEISVRQRWVILCKWDGGDGGDGDLKEMKSEGGCEFARIGGGLTKKYRFRVDTRFLRPFAVAKNKAPEEFFGVLTTVAKRPSDR